MEFENEWIHAGMVGLAIFGALALGVVIFALIYGVFFEPGRKRKKKQELIHLVAKITEELDIDCDEEE